MRFLRNIGFAGLLALVAIGLAIRGAAAGEVPGAADYSALMHRLVADHAVPAARDLEARLVVLRERIAGLCADTSSSSAADVAARAFDSAFADTVAAHGRLFVLRFGALAEETRLERLAFVPDRRGVVRRQVTRLLADPDSSATDAATLRDKSVALQGLSALEWIAYAADGSVVLGDRDAGRAFRCDYAGALAARMAALGGEIVEAYRAPSGQTALLVAPGPDNALAHDPHEAAGFAFHQIATSLSLVSDQVLAPVLEEGPPAARAARAPFARSHHALVHLRAALGGIETALRTAGFARMDADAAWIGDTLAFETNNAVAALDALPSGLAAALADPDQRAKLAYVALVLDGLERTVGGELAGHLGFQGGFNALDGD
jgi:predicted lipoprotein